MMAQLKVNKALLDNYRNLLAAQIKIDIARTIRHHPHLDEDASQQAYAALANPATVDQLIAEMAREEVEQSMADGELPPAAMIHLAGYAQNTIAEG